MPPERSGIADYSALLVPALRERVEVEVVRRGRKRPPRGVDLSVYHIGNNPDAHGWIVDALRRAPGLVVLHDFVLHHLVAGLTIGRRDGHGYLDAMEREARRRRAAARARRARQAHPAAVGEPAAGLPAGRRGARIAPRASSSTRDYVLERARAAGYDRPIWRVPHPAFPVPGVPTPGVHGRPADRRLRQRQREQARAAAARGVRARAPHAPGCPVAARRRRLARLRPRPAPAAARDRRRGDHVRRAGSTSSASGR